MRIGKSFMRIMPVLMALVLMITSVVPVNASVSSGNATSVSSGDGSSEGDAAVVNEGKIIFETDFSESNPFSTGGSGGTVALVTDDEIHGQAVSLHRTASTGDFFIYKADVNAETANTSVVYEADMKLLGEKVYSTFVLRSTDAKFYWPSFQIQNSKLLVLGTEVKQFDKDKWYTISMVCDYSTMTGRLYVDGEQVGEDFTVKDIPADATLAAQLRIYNLGKGGATGTEGDFLVDDVKVYEGTKPMHDADSGNSGDSGDSGDSSGSVSGGDSGSVEEETPVVDITEGARIFETDFEEKNPFIFKSYDSGKMESVSDDDKHGTAVALRRTGTADFFMYYSPVNAQTAKTSVVYEMDVKLLGDKVRSSLCLRADTANFSWPWWINNGVLADAQRNTIKTLESGTWYTISLVYDYNAKVRSLYVDGELLSDKLPIESDFVDADRAVQLRIYNSATTDYTGTNADFYVDNVRVYEGTQPFQGELVEKEVVITIDPNKSIFLEERYNTDKFDTMLQGYVALHTRSGMVYKEGAKTELSTAPVKSGEAYLVVLSEICEALDITYQVNGTNVTVNDHTIAIVEKDGKVWVDAKSLLETYGAVAVDTDITIKSNGMMVAGESAFAWPSAEYDASDVFHGRSDLQKLNNYLFFERPSSAQITEAYAESELKGVHPRISASADDFARIREEVKTDSVKKKWYQQLLETADYLVETNTTPLTYELKGGRLYDVSNAMRNNMYALGMAYQLTGEQKYADRAWLDLESVSNFGDWDPKHDLDYAIMSMAVAVGYDWMYHGFTEEQRQVIEKGMYKNGFAIACESYESSYGVLGTNPVCLINHNIIVNGSLAMSAIAFMDVYPEVAAHISSLTIRGADIMLTEYGKDGAWREGTNYWNLSTQYTVNMLSSLETVFGTCFGLDLCEGLESTVEYALMLQSDVGTFNFGDASVYEVFIPSMFYLSNKYDDPDTTSVVLKLSEGRFGEYEDYAKALLWYDTDIKASMTEMPLDACYEDAGVITMRDQWTTGVTTFAGIHGGKNQECHGQIDAGTFVYDYAGLRWAKELGKTPYNTSVTAEYGTDGRRWLLYRSLPEAHNCIVINPDNSTGQKVDTVATMELVESKEKGSIGVVDLSKNYSANASSAIRGIFFTDDRTSLVVRDEVKLTQDNSTIYWFMHTDAEVEIGEDGKSALLTQMGKQVKLDFVTSGNGTVTISVGPSTRELLGSTSPITKDSDDPNYYDVEDPETDRIVIKLTGASGEVAITTKLTPVGVSSTSVSDYDKSISEWTVSDGTIAEKPELQSVVIDGRTVKFDATNQATFLCVEGRNTTVPEPVVTVDEMKYTYEIINAETTDGGATKIVVSEKDNAGVYTTYIVNMEEIPVPRSFEGMSSLQAVYAEASDEPEGIDYGHVAWKTIDGDVVGNNSRWTSIGMGQWLIVELEQKSVVDNMMIMFGNGHLRSTYFNVEVSTDGVNFVTIVPDTKSAGTALGSAEAFEQIALGGVTAKYIRINCNGNSLQGTTAGWNNIKEVVFTGNVIESEDDATTAPEGGTTTNPEGGTTMDPEGGTTMDPESSTTTDSKDSTAATQMMTQAENADSHSTENADAISTKDAVATGDDSNVLLWSMMFLMAFAGLAAVSFYHRKTKNR